MAAERDGSALHGDLDVAGLALGMALEGCPDLGGHVRRHRAPPDRQAVDQAAHAAQRTDGMRRQFALVRPVDLTGQGHPPLFDQHLDPVGRKAGMPFQRGPGRLRDRFILVRTGQLHFDFLDHATHARDPFGGALGGQLFDVAAHLTGQRNHAMGDFHADPRGIDGRLPHQFVIDVLLDPQVAFHSGLLFHSSSCDVLYANLRSREAWQARQRLATGWACSRRNGMGSPQSMHTPYCPCAIRSRAASTLASSSR